jgi:hypothetical protein
VRENESFLMIFHSSQSDMSTLMDDTDWEVRLRVCNLLHQLWKAEKHISERSKKGYIHDDKHQPHFYALSGDRLLLLSVRYCVTASMQVLQK